MKLVTTSKVPDQVARYASEIATREFLRPSAVIQSFMQRGMLQYQLEQSRRRNEDK